jgi:D-sedoheptulose 7-phosphate isomerase
MISRLGWESTIKSGPGLENTDPFNPVFSIEFVNEKRQHSVRLCSIRRIIIEGTMSVTEDIERSVTQSAVTISGLKAFSAVIAAAGTGIVQALKSGNKVLIAGNGGSAAEALHMSEELIGRFKSNRIPLPGIALVADATALTCIGNDFGFDFVFSRQIEGLGKAGDILVLFSTSGNSENLLKALESAHKKDIRTVCLLGRNGGKLAGQGTWQIMVPGEETARIQEAHQVILHILLEMVEKAYVTPS